MIVKHLRQTPLAKATACICCTMQAPPSTVSCFKCGKTGVCLNSSCTSISHDHLHCELIEHLQLNMSIFLLFASLLCCRRGIKNSAVSHVTLLSAECSSRQSSICSCRSLVQGLHSASIRMDQESSATCTAAPTGSSRNSQARRSLPAAGRCRAQQWPIWQHTRSWHCCSQRSKGAGLLQVRQDR